MINYFASLISLIAIRLLSAHALALTLNVARVFNLAHVALFGLGAYTAGVVALRYDGAFILCLLLAAVLPALLAALISLVALRQRGDQVALLTLGLNLLLLSVFTNARSLTGGASGLAGIPVAAIGEYSLESTLRYSGFCLFVCCACIGLLWRLRNSKLGTALVAQGEYPAAAEALGLDPAALKRLAFIISGAVVGLAGALSAFRIGIVEPGSFGFAELSLLLMIVILGGSASFWGTSIATIALTLMPEILRLLPFWQTLGGQSGAYIQLINALVVYMVLRSFRSTSFRQARNYV